MAQQVGTMPKCIVRDCPYNTENQFFYPGVILHTFPNDFARAKLWLLQIGQITGDVDCVAGHILNHIEDFRICSAHFSIDSYIIQGSKLELKPDAKPTVFTTLINPLTQLNSGFQFTNYVNAASAAPALTTGDMNHNVVPQRTPTHPHSGDQGIAMLPRPFPMKDASTSTRGYKRYYKRGRSVDKAVQWPEDEFNSRGNSWIIDHDHFYHAGQAFRPVVPPVPEVEVELDQPVVIVPIPDLEENGFTGWRETLEESHKEYSRLSRDLPWDDCNVFLALENVLTSLMRHLASRHLSKEDTKMKIEKILNQALEIICLLTGNEWTIAEKDIPKCSSGGVPVQFGDVAVYFSFDEWDYLEKYPELYGDLIEENSQLLRTIEHHAQQIMLPEEYVSGDEAGGVQSSPEWIPDNDSNASERVVADEADKAGSGGEESKHSKHSDKASEVESNISSDHEERDDNDSDFDEASETKNSASADAPETMICCYKCDLTLPNKQALKKHLKSHKDADLACSDCGRFFNSQSRLDKHRAENHTAKRYVCAICGIQYEYKSQFIIHLRAHTGEKPFECNECGKSYGHRSSLLAHQKSHLNTSIVKCDICGREFKNKSGFMRHRNSHKQKHMTYKCRRCDNLFKTKLQLTRHEERVHDKKKRLKCEVCEERFESRKALLEHETIHDDD